MLISLAGFKQSHITLLFLLRISKDIWLVDFLLPGVVKATSFFYCQKKSGSLRSFFYILS